MKNLKSYIAAAMLLTAVAASAQTADGLRAAYFMDGYIYGHELNPAFATEYNYAAMPFLTDINIGVKSNVGLSTFLYPIKNADGKQVLATFMHPDVSSKQFLKKIHSSNHINENLNLTIYSHGFQAFGGYNTIGISIREGASAAIPGDLFKFMKLGMTGESTHYNFKNLGVDATALAEISLGHSHQILPQLRIGAKVKFLVGLANANMRIDNLDVNLSGEEWRLKGRGHVNVSAGPGFDIPTNSDGEFELDDIKFNSYSPSGFGVGFDLGVSYQLLPELTLSAALRDLSFICWNHTRKGAINNAEWSFKGFQNVALGDSDDEDGDNPNSLDNQIDNLVDDLKNCFDFRKVNGSSRTSGLGATFNFGAEYTLPMYDRFRAGFLFTQRINGPYSWSEGRFSANIRPIDQIELSASYGVSSFGSSFGWVVMFPIKGFNLFVGSDHQFFKFNKWFIPVGNANASVSMGISFTYGKKVNRALSPQIAKKI